jgi:hypothetical protein
MDIEKDFSDFRDKMEDMEGIVGVYRIDKDGPANFLARKIGDVFLYIGFLIHDIGCYKETVDNRDKDTS